MTSMRSSISVVCEKKKKAIFIYLFVCSFFLGGGSKTFSIFRWKELDRKKW